MAEIKLLKEDKKSGKATYEISGASPAFVNALRRTIIDEVPTMAIETVEISKNSSILYDEMVALRLGLVPLSTDLKTYNLPKDCKCQGEGCARCSVQMVYKSKGIGYQKIEDVESKDPKIKPVYGNMPVTKLSKGQELEFIATAALGIGKDHSKWTPAHVWYVCKPEIKINNSSKKIDEFREKYPPQIFDKNGKIVKENIAEPYIIDACDGICDDIIKIEYDKSSFVFYVESFGQLSCKEIMQKALEIMGSHLDEFKKNLKELA